MAKTDWLENEREGNCMLFPSIVIRKYKNGDVVRTGTSRGKDQRPYSSFLAQEFGGPVRRFTAFGEKGEDIVKMQLTPGCVCFIVARENAQLKKNDKGLPDGYEYRYEVDRIQIKRRPESKEGEETETATATTNSSLEFKTNVKEIPAEVKLSADMFLKTPLGETEKRFG